MDITEVHEYFWGIVVGCLLTIIPILFIVIGKYFKKNKTLNAEETRDIELEERNAKKQIESLITNQGILNISGAPQDIRLESGRLSSDNNDYYRYVSLYGKCYHADSTCVNTFLEKIFFTELRKELTPCSHCAERIIIPDWYKRFIELKGIINKYSIIIPSLVVENHESYQQHRLRVEREAILYRVGTISSQMNPSSKKPPSNNK